MPTSDFPSNKDFIWGLAPWLLISGLLHFYGLGQQPYTNDELSALSRLDFSTFAALLQNGVTPDAHPAFTELWLWLFTGVFGDEPWAVRTPFILASLSAFVIGYRLVWLSFGKSSADLSAALIACSQPFLYFGVVARPYAFGLLFTMSLAYIWYILIWRRKRNLGYYIAASVLLALNVYTHYFSGLTAIIIWLSGLFFWRKLHLSAYLLTALGAAVLFVPHLGITMTQIGHKGIGGWLKAPDESFLFEWFMAQINYSNVALVLLCILAAITLFSKYLKPRLQPEANFGLAVLWTSWILFTFLIAFVYSHKIDPLLHHGTLFFASPFLLMAIAAFLRPRYDFLAKSAPYLFAFLLLYQLFVQRNHYEVMNLQAHSTIADYLSGQNAPNYAVISQNPVFMKYYFSKNSCQAEQVINLTNTAKSHRSVLQHLVEVKPDRIYLDGRQPILLKQLSEYYHAQLIHDGFTFSGFELTQAHPNPHLYEVLATDSSFSIMDGEFFNLLPSIPLTSLPLGFADHIGATFKYVLPEGVQSHNVHLVCEIKREDRTIHWSSAKFEEDGMIENGTYSLSHQLLLWDFFLSEGQMEGASISMYIWNPDRLALGLRGWDVSRLPGPENRYGLLYRKP